MRDRGALAHHAIELMESELADLESAGRRDLEIAEVKLGLMATATMPALVRMRYRQYVRHAISVWRYAKAHSDPGEMGRAFVLLGVASGQVFVMYDLRMPDAYDCHRRHERVYRLLLGSQG